MNFKDEQLKTMIKELNKSGGYIDLRLGAGPAVVLFTLFLQFLSNEAVQNNPTVYTLIFHFAQQIYDWLITNDKELKKHLTKPIPTIKLVKKGIYAESEDIDPEDKHHV